MCEETQLQTDARCPFSYRYDIPKSDMFFRPLEMANAQVPHLKPLSHADLCQHLLPRHGWTTAEKNNQHASSTLHPSHYPSPIGIFVQKQAEDLRIL